MGASVELITIGDELLLGFTLDSNGAHLARELAAVGVDVVRRTSVGDDAAAITAAVREAIARTGAVITTGGLGPTSDDITKPSIAAAFGRTLVMHDGILQALRERWVARGWGRELPKANEQQAMVPEGAAVLTNRHGSAPGIWLEDAAGRWIATLPGVPREMRGMFAEEVLPRVTAWAAARGGPSGVVRSATLRTTSIAESLLAERIAPVMPRLEGLSLAYLPNWPGVDLRLTSRGRSASDTDAALAAGLDALRSVAGDYAYGTDTQDLAEVVLDLLRARGFTLAVAESCTGGLLGGRITAISGSSHHFVGGVIAYANEVKTTHLGVGDDTLIQFGAVSEPTAREMASGVRARYRSDVAVSITGIAGPGGGTAEKPVGTVCVAVDVQGTVSSARRTMVGDREEVRLRSTQWALDQARRRLA